MPVTFAHPLAVIPLKKIFPKLSLTAMVCGACGPDLEYFIPFVNIDRGFTHSFAGIFFTSLPLALIIFFLFELLFRKVVLDILPWQISLPRQKHSLMILALSVLIGAASHVIWDSFTHENTFFTSTFSIFRYPLFTLFGHKFLVLKVLQYASGIVGTAAVIMYSLNQYRKRIIAGSEADWSRLTPLLAASLLAPVLTLLITGLPSALSPALIYPYVKPILTTGTVSFLLIVYCTNAIMRYSFRLKPEDKRQSV